MTTVERIKEHLAKVEFSEEHKELDHVRLEAVSFFNRAGIPGAKHEEWKYTRIGNLFNKEYRIAKNDGAFTSKDIVHLPGHDQANEIVFLNGRYSRDLSKIISPTLKVISIEEAMHGAHAKTIKLHLGHSGNYQKDGVHALNTAFIRDAIFFNVDKGNILEHPVYIYNITDARAENTLSMPRSLVHIGENAQVQMVETYMTIGSQESFTNQVIEIVVEKDAVLEYYKIQNDNSQANLVSTTHIKQVGKSYTHTVTITLNGGIVRNNLNMVMEAEHCEAHLYGLYLQAGQTHVDNHTVVDNVKPHCYSNELYKGVLADQATGVFNGKIFVRPQAQKTNAYQSNKNVLLSDTATVNTKPQLEIFADDVKCSHGCTVGQLDDEGQFYLQSRGIPEQKAKALLLQGFAIDILETIRLQPVREYVDHLISERLELI